MRNVLSILMVAVFVSTAVAQQPATQNNRELMKGTITGIKGLVSVREKEGDPWKRAEIGMVVMEDHELRTGPNSAVQIKIPPDQTITLDRLSTLKLVTAVKEGNKIKTDLGMKYGRTRYDIEAAGQEHESTISSPSSTLAVRGTEVSSYNQRPFRPEVVSLTGRAVFKDGKKQMAFGGKNAGKTKVAQGDAAVGSYAYGQSVIDPTLRTARTPSDGPLVGSLVSRGATVAFDRYDKFPIVFGGTHPLTDQELIPTLPGTLNFVLRWDANVNLNFVVSTSFGGRGGGGEVLFPANGLSTSATGGKIAFDHRGGPNGGMEIVSWNRAVSGSYGLGVLIADGAPATPATVDVFLGGQRVGIFDGIGIVPTANVTVLPPTPGISEGTLAGTVQITGPAAAPAAPLAATVVPQTAQPLTAQRVTPAVQTRAATVRGRGR